jgi:hypothetical protein
MEVLRIMSHILVKYPLEIQQPSLLVWLQIVIASLLRINLSGSRAAKHRKRFYKIKPKPRPVIIVTAPKKHQKRSYKIKPKPRPIILKQHHGSTPLLPEFNSARYQEVLAAAIVWTRGKGKARSETPAIFIQKIREWTEINRAKGFADPRPYRSYQEWCDKNFPAQNFASIQRVIEDLETLGLLITEADPKQAFKKRFAVNEDAVRDLVERWAAVHPEIAREFRGTVSRLDKESPRLDPSTTRLDPQSGGLDTESHKVVKKASNQFKIKGASPKDTGPLARNDKISFDSEPADSDSHSLSDPLQSPGQDASNGEHQDSPPPVPLTPSHTGKWETAYAQLAALLDRPTFDTLLKEAVLLACDGGRYRVGVKSEYAQAQLSRGYYRKIENVFRGLHNAPVKIEFEVM